MVANVHTPFSGRNRALDLTHMARIDYDTGIARRSLFTPEPTKHDPPLFAFDPLALAPLGPQSGVVPDADMQVLLNVRNMALSKNSAQTLLPLVATTHALLSAALCRARSVRIH
jgi:hypothetical protein